MFKKTLLFTFFILHSLFSIALGADWFLPQTGQTSCYNATGSVSSCTGTGQDGDTLTGQAWPNPRFTVNMQADGVTPNGTVTDNLTGLIWLKKADCTETVGGIDRSSNHLTWADALTWSNNLASGACDLADGSTVGQWRVPNIVELESLVNVQQAYQGYNQNTWLNGQGFAGVYASSYWSSSTSAFNTDYARYVNFSYGAVSSVNKTGSYSVLPVRGGHAAAVQLPATGQTSSYAAGDDGALQQGRGWPSPRFTLNSAAPDNGGSVTDNLTGLVWTQNGNSPSPGPYVCSPGIFRSWQSALNYVTCLNTNNYLGHADWRLPNRKELFSLINWQQSNSATWLNGQGFADVQGNGYWSSSSSTEGGSLGYRFAWYVTLGSTSLPVYGTNKTSSNYVWPVRGGQIGLSEPFALSVTVNGLGSGTITTAPQGTNPVGISCTSGTCSTTYPASQSVTLSALPGITTSTFGGWGGDCAGTGDCLLTMDAAKSATATFNLAPVAKNITAATDHATLIDALTVANPGAELNLLGIQHDGTFVIDKSLTLKGGWNAAYSGLSGAPTVLNGGLNVTAGDSIGETLDIIDKLSVAGGSFKVKAVTVH